MMNDRTERLPHASAAIAPSSGKTGNRLITACSTANEAATRNERYSSGDPNARKTEPSSTETKPTSR